MKKINFGCGLSAADDYVNYDSSPTLRLQRLPLIGSFAKSFVKPRFPDLVTYGNISKGLPEPSASADFVYCSHVLEHLSLADFRLALAEVFRILKPGGIFRGVLPDLESEVRAYLADDSVDACSRFMRSSSLGQEQRPSGLVGRLRSLIGNSQHLWMWDYKGIAAELEHTGFVEIRHAEYGDSRYPEFETVEDPDRWVNCLGFECRKSG
jgi:SAM-dependent methyltransferase